MRQFLAIALLGGALIVSASAAFAQDTMSPDQSTVSQNMGGEYTVDQQTTPLAPNVQAQ